MKGQPHIDPQRSYWAGGHLQRTVVASVRKDSEKRLVRRAIKVMFSTNISFEKVRVEFISSALSSSTTSATAAAAASGWAYCIDPAFDYLAS